MSLSTALSWQAKQDPKADHKPPPLAPPPLSMTTVPPPRFPTLVEDPHCRHRLLRPTLNSDFKEISHTMIIPEIVNGAQSVKD
uniref:Uncharacterized protein n=1 Tax=Cannabis sativa TaxID=3483 RepID=A0A803NKS5_CANSA